MPRIAKLVPRKRGSWIELVPHEGAGIKLPLHAVPAEAAPGADIDERTWAQLAVEGEYYLLYDRALRILSLREHFVRELESKLRTRSRSVELIGRVIGELKRREYLDDERAAAYVAEAITRKGGVGPQLLRLELTRRGCPPQLLAGLVAEYAQTAVDEDLLGKLLEKKRSFFVRKRDSLLAKLTAKHGAAEAGPTHRRVVAQLRQQLGHAVVSWLQARGFSDDDARSRGRQLVDELVEE
jgi:SOS response regulatory protein OraA/RecX